MNPLPMSPNSVTHVPGPHIKPGDDVEQMLRAVNARGLVAGWVERSEIHRSLASTLMGIASLNPSCMSRDDVVEGASCQLRCHARESGHPVFQRRQRLSRQAAAYWIARSSVRTGDMGNTVRRHG
jgi:hypothetical protein